MSANAYVLLRHRDIPDLNRLTVYQQNGGFDAWRKALETLKPEEVLAVVKDSGLRGRGGAGFPTGVKWSFLPNNLWPHYVVANADESEPGTFKDREILENNPFQFLEGLALACFAVGAHTGYVYLRGEFEPLARELDERIAEMEAAGFLGERILGSEYDLRLHTHLGAGAYICGEETALLDSIGGRLGQPRLRPPFPATYGVFGYPTVVNNVETLTNVPMIVDRGAAWFRSMGTEKSPGPKIFCLSGRVNKPGNYELPLGTTFRELIYNYGGGILGGMKIKAILPAGASSTILPVTDESILDTPMDYEATTALGSPLGSASVIVIDETVNMAWLVDKTVHFFMEESCGKCTPCREGTYWMAQITRRIAAGEASEADIQLLDTVAAQMQGKCLCALGEFSTMAVRSAIAKFRVDFETRLEKVPHG
jgi:NADH-quinone oxidoreductase subunit F